MLSKTLENGLSQYSIGEKLRALRLRKKIGLVDLGKHTGLSPALLSKIENGKLFPTLPTLLRIAMVYSVGLERFFPAETTGPVLAVLRRNDRQRFPDVPGSEDVAYHFESLDFPVASSRAAVASRPDGLDHGYFVEPSAAYRFTAYELDGTEPGQPSSPTRGAPILSLDTGLTFERTAGRGGKRIQTLDPRLLYAYVPYRNQSSLPNFDTGLPDLSLEQVFRTNRYTGADRLSDANQLAFGVTTRMIESSTGRQYFAATLGQIYYFSLPRVLLPDESPPEGQWSNLIGRVSVTAYRNWNVELGTEWDPNSRDAARGDVTLQYRPSRDRLINVSYRYQRERHRGTA